MATSIACPRCGEPLPIPPPQLTAINLEPFELGALWKVRALYEPMPDAYEHRCGTPQDAYIDLAHAACCPRCRSLYPGVTHGGCQSPNHPHAWHTERHAVED